MLIALIRVVWLFGFVLLTALTLANLLFGSSEMHERFRDLLPRLVVAAVWPLAILTPRGRTLLKSQWANRR